MSPSVTSITSPHVVSFVQGPPQKGRLHSGDARRRAAGADGGRAPSPLARATFHPRIVEHRTADSIRRKNKIICGSGDVMEGLAIFPSQSHHVSASAWYLCQCLTLPAPDIKCPYNLCSPPVISASRGVGCMDDWR